MLLQELFTAEGAGTQIGSGDYRVVRNATDADIGGIVELITPLEQSGALVPRPRDRIEREIVNFVVAELDGALTGCCALHPLADGSAELACLVGGEGVGDRLLEAIVERARANGVQRLFALTTRAGDWFAERGFASADVTALPGSRKALYNYRRGSKVFCLELRKASASHVSPPRELSRPQDPWGLSWQESAPSSGNRPIRDSVGEARGAGPDCS